MAEADRPVKSEPYIEGESDPDVRDKFFMGFALAEACAARDAGEVPIGAVIVRDDEIVGRGHNQPIGLRDPTAHAEMIALHEAARRLGNYRLPDTTMYVTLEPCAMCAGALVHARIKRLVFGSKDARAGGVVSIFTICSNGSLNHQVEVAGGVLAEQARELIQSFFRARRNSTDDTQSDPVKD